MSATVKAEQHKKFAEVYKLANAAGFEAANQMQTIPMVVNQHANPLDDNSAVARSYFVADGVCGFAWLELKGNTAFAKWAVEAKVARKGYPRGIAIWCHDFNQSMQRKTKWAHTVCRYLRTHLQVESQVFSRMD